MLVVKYYQWNHDEDVYELKIARCTEVYSQNDCTIIAKLEGSNCLVSVHLDQLISIKPIN